MSSIGSSVGGAIGGSGGSSGSTAASFASTGMATLGMILDGINSKKNREYMDKMRELDIQMADRERRDTLTQNRITNAQTNRSLDLTEAKNSADISSLQGSQKAVGVKMYLDAISKISRANPGVANGIAGLFSSASSIKEQK